MEEDVKKVLEQNAKLLKHIHKLTEEIHLTTHKIRRYTIISEIMGYLKILLIIIPLILGAVYLSPTISDALSKYQDLMNGKLPTNSLQDLKKPINQQEKPSLK
ncbi:MAG: hypothetical protein NT091_00790 [Candidatus Falkowbacteria bacterium]|nr:hypothetical protein [Candidatus Falkowbacteria bacterium]